MNKSTQACRVKTLFFDFYAPTVNLSPTLHAKVLSMKSRWPRWKADIFKLVGVV